MHQIEEIYNLYDCGYNQSEIAEILDIDRKTVSSYLEKTDFNRTVMDEARFHQPRASKLDPYKPIIIELMDKLEKEKKTRKMRWTATRMHEYLWKDLGIQELEHSYLLIQRFMRELKESKKKSYRDRGTMPLYWEPGEAQCDFGLADFIDGDSHETVQRKYMILSFPYSNKLLCMVAPGENCQCVCQCLKDMFEYMGYVPRRIVFDNATGIGHRIQNILQEHEEFTRFRLHYGFEATFANPYSGHEKGSVENAVGTFRRNRLVPFLTIQPNLEEFNNNEMLPLSDAFRAEDEHYKKGKSVDELFEIDKRSMHSLPATDFNVCKIVTCVAHNGLVRIDGKYEYHLDPIVNGNIFVEKSMYRMAFYSLAGELLETCGRLYDSDEIYYNLQSILYGLTTKTNAWRNSIVRHNMEDGPLKTLIDNMESDNDRRRLFYCLYHNTVGFGYGETIHAANLLAESKGRVDKDDLKVLCSRFASIDFNNVTNPTGVSLDKYDALLKSAQ